MQPPPAAGGGADNGPLAQASSEMIQSPTASEMTADDRTFESSTLSQSPLMGADSVDVRFGSFGEMQVATAAKTPVRLGHHGMNVNGSGLNVENVVPENVKKKRGKHTHLHIRSVDKDRPAIKIKQLKFSVEPVGRGSQGLVYKVYDAVSDANFAMKEMECHKAGDASILRELEQVMLKHGEEWMVQSYEAYFLEGKVCILMEWMEHGTLLEILPRLLDSCHQSPCYPVRPDPEYQELAAPAYRLDKFMQIPGPKVGTTPFEENRGRLCQHDLARVALSVLSGLHELSQMSKVHNDIKPANILVGTQGEIKICDFGVSKWTDTISIAKSGTGTERYMAPEKIMGPYGYRADIYSLGITLAHLALGDYPLSSSSGNKFDVVMAIANGKATVTFPPEMGVHPHLQEFIWACLTPDADDRPDAKTLLEHPFLAKFASDTVHFIPVIGQASARPCSVEAQKHYLRR
ncbi:hypothetical protein DIPPA_02072 [Diplonema papillatum]|nr:hypothetical protein DIPPA_02072 [Diplonema papillatum]